MDIHLLLKFQISYCQNKPSKKIKCFQIYKAAKKVKEEN